MTMTMTMTRILVETKYLPATNTRGARIKASASSFKPLTLGYNHGLSIAMNHEDAARTLLTQKAWGIVSVERFETPVLPHSGWSYVITVRDEA